MRLDGIACIRGDRLLFEGLSLTLARGDALWLRGPNGAGKSSLIRLAAGLLRPAAGTVTISSSAPLILAFPALNTIGASGRATSVTISICISEKREEKSVPFSRRRRSSRSDLKPIS